MTNCFDIVPVRIKDEGTVIVRVIMRTNSRRTIISSACINRSPVKGVDKTSA